ncbi:unnamed protein product [Linum trigynum]|uniref:Secreted protein n=1 Tax=Linum trigynum TaxID=586398 RepID=A0AAV2EUR5_9ROSI
MLLNGVMMSLVMMILMLLRRAELNWRRRSHEGRSRLETGDEDSMAPANRDDEGRFGQGRETRWSFSISYSSWSPEAGLAGADERRSSQGKESRRRSRAAKLAVLLPSPIARLQNPDVGVRWRRGAAAG